MTPPFHFFSSLFAFWGLIFHFNVSHKLKMKELGGGHFIFGSKQIGSRDERITFQKKKRDERIKDTHQKY